MDSRNSYTLNMDNSLETTLLKTRGGVSEEDVKETLTVNDKGQITIGAIDHAAGIYYQVLRAELNGKTPVKNKELCESLYIKESGRKLINTVLTEVFDDDSDSDVVLWSEALACSTGVVRRDERKQEDVTLLIGYRKPTCIMSALTNRLKARLMRYNRFIVDEDHTEYALNNVYNSNVTITRENTFRVAYRVAEVDDDHDMYCRCSHCNELSDPTDILVKIIVMSSRSDELEFIDSFMRGFEMSMYRTAYAVSMRKCGWYKPKADIVEIDVPSIAPDFNVEIEYRLLQLQKPKRNLDGTCVSLCQLKEKETTFWIQLAENATENEESISFNDVPTMLAYRRKRKYMRAMDTKADTKKSSFFYRKRHEHYSWRRYHQKGQVCKSKMGEYCSKYLKDRDNDIPVKSLREIAFSNLM